MAGLVPAIHVFLADRNQDVDARVKPGHDDRENSYVCVLTIQRFRESAKRGMR
jgi:hypothetical protein